MKLVLLKNVEFNYETIAEVTDFLSLDYYLEDGRVPISTVVDIDFKMLDTNEVVDAQVTIIDKQMTKVRADAEASITALEGRKQELLAITNEVVS